jgi:hypothetical protein
MEAFVGTEPSLSVAIKEEFIYARNQPSPDRGVSSAGILQDTLIDDDNSVFDKVTNKPQADPRDDDSTEGPEFSVKDVVDVMARLWAGINKPGGRARVTKINYDPEEDEYTYNVSYVLGGTETKVERIYLNLVEDDGSSKRQRHTRGRCR